MNPDKQSCTSCDELISYPEVFTYQNDYTEYQIIAKIKNYGFSATTISAQKSRNVCEDESTIYKR
jgi:hypothetical protein